MLNRRQLVLGTGAVSLGFCRRTMAADLPDASLDEAGRGPLVLGPDYRGPLPADLFTRGKLPPRTEEEAIARQILDAAPRSSPLSIMRYFAGITRLNRDREAYNAGWADRWNPVIVEFYTATADQHSGDTTAWCAAFLNWCLDRAMYKGSTQSTVSGSFRKAPGLTRSPRQGDIVVFKRGSSKCNGHVGLLVGTAGSQYQVIGGNQTDIAGHSSINIKALPVPGAGLSVHSFHRIADFRQAVSPRPSCS